MYKLKNNFLLKKYKKKKFNKLLKKIKILKQLNCFFLKIKSKKLTKIIIN